MKAIVTRYLGPTNRKGARVKASDSDGNSVTQSWDSALNANENFMLAAVALCEKLGLRGTYYGGWVKNGMTFVLGDKMSSFRIC